MSSETRPIGRWTIASIASRLDVDSAIVRKVMVGVLEDLRDDAMGLACRLTDADPGMSISLRVIAERYANALFRINSKRPADPDLSLIDIDPIGDEQD